MQILTNNVLLYMQKTTANSHVHGVNIQNVQTCEYSHYNLLNAMQN